MVLNLRFAKGITLFAKKKLIKQRIIEKKTRGLIKRSREIPEDLIATSSKLSPRFPNVMIEEMSMAIGIASIKSEALAYHKNCPMVIKSKSFPTRSSIYFHRNCMSNTNIEIQKVRMNGPMKDFNVRVVSFFTFRL